MVQLIWSSLWRMHDETRSLLVFRPRSAVRAYLRKHIVYSEMDEKEVQLADALSDAPAEHQHRLKTTPGGVDEEEPHEYTMRQKIGLVIGPMLFFLLLFMPAPFGMEPVAKRMAGVVCLMAIWWMTEAIPIPATSLLPIILFPLLGIMHVKQAASPYASDLIFLFMGGFLIALSMQRWNLHRRVAMNIVRVAGFSPGRLIFGFMLATAVLSAFVSNTATTVMMMPIGLAIITHVIAEGKKEGLDNSIDFAPEKFAFGINLMLGIAYGASIGGIATLIGTPPNTVLAAYLEKTYNFEISFLNWLKIGIPFVLVFLPLCWFWLTRLANPMKLKRVPGGRDLIDQELEAMGRMSPGERWTAAVFLLTAFGWIFRQKLGFLFLDEHLVNDAVIAMFGGLSLFLIPIDIKKNIFVMNWQWASKLPWGVLLLFGGGLAMAGGVKSTGLAAWIGGGVSLLEEAPIIVLLIAVAVLTIFLTELTSNTATAATVIPILAAVSIGIGQNPLILVVPAALVASCAFMLPAATPPNAIVFGSGYISIPQMVKSGVGLNLIGIVLAVTVTWFIVIPFFGVEIGIVPDWARLGQ